MFSKFNSIWAGYMGDLIRFDYMKQNSSHKGTSQPHWLNFSLGTGIYAGKVLVQYFSYILYNRLRNATDVRERHPPVCAWRSIISSHKGTSQPQWLNVSWGTGIYAGKALVQYFSFIPFNRLRNTTDVLERHPPVCVRTFWNVTRPGRVNESVLMRFG